MADADSDLRAAEFNDRMELALAGTTDRLSAEPLAAVVVTLSVSQDRELVSSTTFSTRSKVDQQLAQRFRSPTANDKTIFAKQGTPRLK